MKSYLLAALCLPLLFCSCSMLEERPIFMLSFHELIAESEMVQGELVMPVKTADDRTTRYIRRFPLLSSMNIVRAEPVPAADGIHCGLRLYFDKYSQGIWQDASGYHHGDKVAVIVDGFLAGYTKLPRSFDESGVWETSPLWSVQEARAIAANVEKNYGYFNK